MNTKTSIDVAAASPQIAIHLCVTDEDEVHLPKRRRAPQYLPLAAPLPRVGEYVRLTSTSSWRVVRVVHEWRAVTDLRIEVWLEYQGTARGRRSGPDFTPTQ